VVHRDAPESLEAVKEALTKAGIKPASAEIAMVLSLQAFLKLRMIASRSVLVSSIGTKSIVV
jgi:hypothetical protein